VVGEAENGQKALNQVKKLQPDLITMDISLPDMSGIQLTYEIRTLLPNTKVIMLSMHSKLDYIAESFQAGATGYVVKESASDRLLIGLDAVSKGEYFLDSSISHKVVAKIMQLPLKAEKIQNDEYNHLTPREQEILRLLAQGKTPKKIASKLYISAKTVENHRSNLMKKLNLHCNIDLIRYSARIGLIDLDLWKG